MLKEELKNLYKAKPELIEEHKRLVDVLRTGSKKEQLEEARRQLKELKEMINKVDRCWEGYEPTPGKKPYEKGSCQPVKKEETSSKGWQIKIKGRSGYHDVKDVVDMGPQKHNSYTLHDGTQIHHDQVEDLVISPNYKQTNVRKEDIKSNPPNNSRVAKTDLDDKISVIKAKYSKSKEKSFNQQVKDIKQKYSQKPEPSNNQRIDAMKMKYTSSMFKSDSVQNLLKEVSVRQPTDAELELLLDYNSKIQQDLADVAVFNQSEEDLGF